MKPTIHNGRTTGISPKVKLPAWALFIVGAVLLVIGYIIGDDTIIAVGWSLIGSTGIVIPLGHAASTGTVTQR